jgi:surfactin synthase thioesterase subunit
VSTSWLTSYQPNPQAHLRLFCFPYAGAGASIYRNWTNQLPAAVEVCAVQLPGRETRLREPPFTDLPSLIAALTPALLPALDRPFAFFGHSVGALICFEMVRQLQRSHQLAPLHLFVSGRRSPQLANTDIPLHQLPNDDLIAGLRRYNGTPEVVLQNAELMNLFLPILRADLAIDETYVYTPGELVKCPIDAFGGLHDTKVNLGSLRDWQRQTEAGFHLRLFPGDHFYWKSQPAPLLQAIAATLEQILTSLSANWRVSG